jgi:hypothetical protein
MNKLSLDFYCCLSDVLNAQFPQTEVQPINAEFPQCPTGATDSAASLLVSLSIAQKFQNKALQDSNSSRSIVREKE